MSPLKKSRHRLLRLHAFVLGTPLAPAVPQFPSGYANVLLLVDGGKGLGASSATQSFIQLVADGRRIKTLTIPQSISCLQNGDISIVQLCGIDFLLVADFKQRQLHGWQLKLQTAEQVCSLEQLHDTAVPLQAVGSEMDGCTLDILYQVFAKYIFRPALAGLEHGPGDDAILVRRLTVFSPCVETDLPDDAAVEEQSRALRRYIEQLINRLRKDTQKPELDDLRLEVGDDRHR